MQIIVLGAPGSGKGTQGALLADRLGVPKIATGDLLRAAVRDGTPLGVEARSFMDRGLLVPDEIVLGLIEEVLRSPEAQDGVIMDGFPRTLAQAEAVEGLLADRGSRIDRVLLIDVPEDELVKRMLGRARAEGRSDDTPETIRKRFAVYGEQTAPLIRYYEERGLLTAIVGLGTVREVADRVNEALGR
ncbi:MAG: adenylate kinase [Gemmatimonadales bacterium]